MDYIVHGNLQARILEWVAFAFSRDLPNPGIKPRSPTLQADSLLAEPQGKPLPPGDPGVNAKQMAGELWHLLLRGDHSSHLGLWVAVGPVWLGPPSLIAVETDTDLTVSTSLEQLCSICSRLSPSSWLCLTLAAPWHLGLPELLGCLEQSLPAYVEYACVLRPTAYLFTREGMAFWKGSNFLNNQSSISLESKRTALGAGSVLGSSKLSLRCAYRGFCLTFRVNFCFFPCTHLSLFCCFQGDIAGVQSWATLPLTQELYSCSQVSQELSIPTRSQLPTSPTSLALQGPTPPPFLLGTPLASTGHSRLSLGEVISF